MIAIVFTFTSCSEDEAPILATPLPSVDYLLVPSEYATIQEAVDAAEDGDEIALEPGIYMIRARERPTRELAFLVTLSRQLSTKPDRNP